MVRTSRCSVETCTGIGKILSVTFVFVSHNNNFLRLIFLFDGILCLSLCSESYSRTSHNYEMVSKCHSSQLSESKILLNLMFRSLSSLILPCAYVCYTDQ